MATRQRSSTGLNTDHIVLWFDDLGSGNEQFRFLSNFHEGDPITLDLVTWENLFQACGVKRNSATAHLNGPIEFLTGEHAFAAMKFWGTDWTHFKDIVEARAYTYLDRKGHTVEVNAPNHAKSLGRSRQHPLRPDWEVVKFDVMLAVTRAKYRFGRKEASALLDTGDRLLVEGTYWGDEVWGVALDREGEPGRNWLGTILMARRAELRALTAFGTKDETERVINFVNNTGYYNAEFSVAKQV